MQKKIILANPRGFCAGVDRAITIVERALELFTPPIYVRHEVVHNRFVVDGLKERGAIFVEELNEVPSGNVVIFSAHGVSQQVAQEAIQRSLTVFDATCPLVTKVHMEVARASKKNHEVILIGHNAHPEVVGTMGQYLSTTGGIYLVENLDDIPRLKIKDPENLYYVSQTTLSVDETASIIKALKERFTAIQGPRKDDICYATQNRQDAVRDIAKDVDLMIVVGSSNSSNSNRLKELAENMGTPTFLVDMPIQLQPLWFNNANRIGVTAGASAPKELIELVLQEIQRITSASIEEKRGNKEEMVFEIPKILQSEMK